MGVMTVSSQNFMEIDMPGWWLSGASVDLDFRNGRYYDSSDILTNLSKLLSISRASIGYAKTSGGVLTQFSSGQMRITDLGLLIEDARTNIGLQSQAFNNATWNQVNLASVTDNNTAAPDGTTTACKIVAGTASNSIAAIYQLDASTLPATYSVSIFAKPAGYNFAWLAVHTLTAGRCTVVADLVNGVISSTSTNGVATIASSSAEKLANGWVRIGLIIGNVNGVQDADFSTGIIDTGTPTFNASSQPTFTGDGVNGIYIWGVQVELAPFASSYIPTTTTSATRAADAVSITGSLDTVLRGTNASVVVNTAAAGLAASSGYLNGKRLIGSSPDTGSILFNNTDSTVVSQTSGVINLQATAPGGVLFSLGAKTGGAWSGAGRSVVFGGGTVATDANTGFSATTYFLGYSAANAAYWFGYFNRLAAWNSRLADATLQALTAP